MKLKVVSLNLWMGGYLFPNIISFLKEHDPDILLLQEVFNAHDTGLVENYRSLDALQATFDYPYQDFAPAYLERLIVGKVDKGNAVLSKFPIVSSDLQFFNEPYGEWDAYDPSGYPKLPRNLQHVVVNADGQEVHVYNFQGVYDLNGDNYSERRRNMSRMIIKSVRDKPNVILAGDTNAKLTNQAMRDIEEHLTSVFGDKLQTTFNMRRKDNPGYATAAVDLMYVSPGIQVLNKECPDVDISDHRPLVVELGIPYNKRKE